MLNIPFIVHSCSEWHFWKNQPNSFWGRCHSYRQRG